MEYSDFGETLVEEHLNSNNSSYKFNAKEFDAETGKYYYYGARYYDPKWSMWLSVDPLAEKYPSISPYAYVANNPIKFIDSAGTLKLGNLDEIGINILSHELFHGYQNIKGQGGTSIKNEVEAYLFGDLIERIYFNLNEERLSSLFESGNSFDWFDSSRSFTEKPFSQRSFQKLVDDFKENSGANARGLYDKFPLQRENQSENLYKEFHPTKE